MTNFVRALLGMDADAARAIFADFIRAGALTADQMKFIDNIVTYLTENGRIEPACLFEAPFDRQHADGVLGVFPGKRGDELFGIIRGLQVG